MKCLYCDYDNDDDSKFCISCGKNLHKKEGEEKIENILFVPKKIPSHVLRNIFLTISVIGVLVILVLIVSGLENTSTTNNSSTNGGTNQITKDNNGWQPFTSVEHGFTVSFPKYPTTERIPEEKINGISYSGVQYVSTPDNDTGYLVQVADYDIIPTDYDNKTGLEGMVNGITSDGSNTLTGSTFAKFQGYDAINFTLTSKDGYYGRGVAFVRNDLIKVKAFILMLFKKSNNFFEYNNFINSFRFN